MSLNKPQLIIDLGTLYDDTLTSAGSEADAKLAFVTRLADIIDGYVKSAQVNYVNGLAAGSSPVTGVFNMNIS